MGKKELDRIKLNGHYWGLVASERSKSVLKTLRNMYYSDRKYRIVKKNGVNCLYVRGLTYPKKRKR